ncbi:MAG: beta-galactosidase trimerization domain-containing protein [Spirochaetes bacterium]|nr:beta-galactosidase trimerization domain-containing protein [Spirochaetota bacterium]
MKLRFRQVHLDFHTSELIPDVGASFSKEQFQKALRAGHVNSITVFSKCHHGLTYHDTEVGVKHPHLKKPLLPLMIDAAHEIDVNTPVYLSAGLDEAMAHKHPEWLVKNVNGATHNPLQAGYKALCFNSPYLDYLCAQIDEVLTMFKTDGIFLDIIGLRRCYCEYCMSGMIAEGLDAANEADVTKYQIGVLNKYYEQTTKTVRRHGAGIPLFHNSGHITRGKKDVLAFQTHLELESLPTGGWGYDHFPLSARYAVTTGMEFLGMTGKFHTTWGEFGGFKHPNALRYEGAAMIANGAKCSVGDQLHPSGEMDMPTYELIGAAYAEVEAKEKFCDNTTTASEVAFMSAEAVKGGVSHHSKLLAGDEGAARMLLESHIMFDVIDTEADLGKYKLLILPDDIILNDELAGKINRFLRRGGKLIMSYVSGMNAERTKFLVDTKLGVRGESEWQNDYIKALAPVANGIVTSPFVTYHTAMRVDAKHTELLAEAWQPYFNRNFAHFCSHQHTPYEKPADYPAVVRDKNIIYFAHPIFSMYRTVGQLLYRTLFTNAVKLLFPEGLQCETNLPSTARVSIMKQENKTILHVLNAVPVKRGGDGEGRTKNGVEVIEDIIPLYDVKISLRMEKKPATVLLFGESTLPFTYENGKMTFTLKRVDHHAMVIIE